MVVQDLVETTQAHAGRLLFFILTNPDPTPNALDHEGVVCFLLVHERIILSRGYDLVKTFSAKTQRRKGRTSGFSLRLCGRN
jgi:hypothetical protein